MSTATTGGGLRWDWAVIRTLWLRDFLRLRRERSRWLGIVLQPVLFWVILGSGFADSFRLAGDAETDYLAFFYPGILVMIMLFSTIFAMMALIEDRQSGFLQGILAGPASRPAMVLGRLAGLVSMVLLQTGLFMLLAPLAGYPFGAVDWALLLLAIVLGALLLGALNFAAAWLLDSTQGYHAVMGVVLIPLWVLSGAMFPPGDGLIGRLMVANPMHWMVEAVRAGLEGSSTPAAWAVVAGLALGAVVAVALAGWVSRPPAGGGGGSA
ncbi:MAG: ABC transporter [Deltaproteobacteria bacterium]|nr:MAG: ABC transporter [Deltaproteobacteria bacterium]